MYRLATHPKPLTKQLTKPLKSLTLACLLMLLGQAAMAAQTASAPITITADNAQFSRTENTSTYTGNVILKRGGLTLTGTKLVINLVGENGVRAELTGNPATLERTPQSADAVLINGHANRVIYTSNNAQVLLRGQAVITRGGDVIRSSTIRHNLDTQRTVAESGSSGDGRVEITLHPGEGSDPVLP